VSESLRDKLERKLAEARASTWEHTQPLEIALDLDESDAGDGSVVAGARYLVQKRSGEWVTVHEEPAVKMSDEIAVDDFLARGLSIFLMKHPSWPR
jgi:hypothetical protein